MGNRLNVWAENVSKTGFTVVGQFINNGTTYDNSTEGTRFTLWVRDPDGAQRNIYDRALNFNKGQSFTYSASWNVSASASSRTYTIGAWWDSSVYADVENSEASTTVTISASQYSAKAPTDVKATCSDTKATITWKHDGSETAYPCSGFSISKDGFNTSTSVGVETKTIEFSGLDANKSYTFEVRANGSAGNSNRVSSNTVYTSPNAPTVSSTYIMALSDTAYNCSVDLTNNAISPSGKIDLQYSRDKSTWYGPNGSTSSVYSLNGTISTEINDASATKLDDTLKNILKSKRNQELNNQSQTSLYFRGRAYNSGNSTPSNWSTASATTNVTSIAKMFVRLPEKSSLKNIYFRVSDASKRPTISFRK